MALLHVELVKRKGKTVFGVLLKNIGERGIDGYRAVVFGQGIVTFLVSGLSAEEKSVVSEECWDEWIEVKIEEKWSRRNSQAQLEK